MDERLYDELQALFDEAKALRTGDIDEQVELGLMTQAERDLLGRETAAWFEVEAGVI